MKPPLLKYACLAMSLVLVACANVNASPTTSVSAPTTTDPTARVATTFGPTTPTPESLSDQEHAYCAGALYGVDEFGSEIANPEWHRLWDGYTRADCEAEVAYVQDYLAEVNPGNLPSDPDGWFVAGCYPSGLQFSLELTQSQLGEGDMTELDEQLTESIAIETCSTPLDLAWELDVVHQFTERGVCFDLDFDPTAEQKQAGLIPCAP